METLVYCYDQAVSHANGIVGVGVSGRDAFHLFQAVLTRYWGGGILAECLFISLSAGFASDVAD